MVRGRRYIVWTMILMVMTLSAWGQCIDFYDLTASYVRCEIGPYNARTNASLWEDSVANYGSNAMNSRHTVHTDLNEIDDRTTNNGTQPGLHTVPEGEQQSVRLGNWRDGYCISCSNQQGQAERITYSFKVTDENKYLVLRYAIVWENPDSHNDQVPSFQVEAFAGEHGTVLLNDICHSFEQSVSNTMADHQCRWQATIRECRNGWNWTYHDENHYIAWRDWRTRIINLEAYKGDTVRLRLTSSDCGHKDHFGYSYFTLSCLNPNMSSPDCGFPTDMRTFVAPTGLSDTQPGQILSYTWFKVDKNHNRLLNMGISTNTLTVQNDSSIYECMIAAPDNDACRFSLYATAAPRAPIADFAVDLHTACVDTVYLIDKSGVSYDGTTVAYPHENVDEVRWDYGDGVRTNAIYTPGQPITYAHDGTYVIKQTAKLGPGNCESTVSYPVTVRGYSATHEGDVYDTICNGKSYIWNSHTYTQTGVYPYVMSSAAAGGKCDSVARLHLKVWDAYHWPTDTIDVREGIDIPYVWTKNGSPVNLYTSGLYIDSCVSIHGCDSIHRLLLRVRPKHFIPEYDTICYGDSLRYHKNGMTVYYTQPGIYYDSLLTQSYGNDSVYCLSLFVRPSYKYSETLSFCHGDTLTFHGQRFWTDGPHTVHFNSRYGCDSSYTVVMKQLEPSLRDTSATVTDKQLPFRWRNRYDCMTSGLYYDSLTAANGCDSITRLHLTVKPTYFFNDPAVTVCQGTAYNFHDTILTTSGLYQRRYKSKVYGTDSVHQILFTVKPTYETIIHADIAEGEEYDFFGTKYSTGGVYSYTFTENSTRCDSTVTLYLSTRPTYSFLLRDTICEGDTYHFHRNGTDRPLTKSGVYWDSCTTVHGFDSIYRLELTVNRSYHFAEAFTICEGDTLYRHGQSFFEQRTYTVPFLTKSGCDSIYTLTLTVNPRYETTLYQTICEGEYVMFAGQSRTIGGLYTDHQLRTTGCDSITHLNLTVRPKQRREEDVHLCGGDYFNFKGRHITTAGLYADTLSSTVTGCDSIHTYHVYVHPVTRDTDSVSICQGEQYLFHGNTFSTSGTHKVTGQSAYGCDSTYVLVLKVNPVTTHDTTLTLCHGNSVSVFGRLYTSGGEYRDTLTASTGCDSIYRIHIHEYPKFLSADRHSLCQGDTWTWRNRQITEAGVYYDSLVSTLTGCDSVYQMTVNIRNTHHTTLVKSILSVDYYDFNGTVLTQTGTYYDHLISEVNGCDSLVELQLTVNPVYDITETHTMCAGETYVWNNQVLTTTGDYTAHLKSVYNTDSIVHLGLTVYNPLVHELPVVHISDQESYTWHGTTYTTTGTYTYDTTSLVTGCDSITRLRLVVHPTYRFDDYETLCGNQYYTWNKNGSSYNTAGEYIYNPKTEYWNYDSIYVLHLTILPTYTRTENAFVCAGSYYNFHGKPLSEGGLYVDTIPTASGCDSITYLTLTKQAVSSVSETHTICQGETYDWHGRTLSGQGVYFDTARYTNTGCDSVRYTLTLKMNKRFYQEQTGETCSNEPFVWRGRSLNRTGIYYDSLHSVYAPFCDSVYCLHLTVKQVFDTILYDTICEGEYYVFGGSYLHEGGVYKQTYTAINGCDSTVELRLTVKPITRILIRQDLCDGEVFRFHGIDYTIDSTYRDTTQSVLIGCDSITTYDVRFHPVVHDSYTAETCEGTPFRYYGHEFYYSGQYTIGGPSEFGCDSTHTLNLTVHPTYRKDTVVTLCSGDSKTIFNQVYSKGGVYRDTLFTAHGCDSIYTITIQEDAHESVSGTWSMCKGDYYDWRGRRITTGGTYRDTVKHASGCEDVYELIVTLRQPAYKEIEATIPSTTYYDLNGRILRNDGIYYDTIFNGASNGCDSVVRLKLTITPVYYVDEKQHICIGESFNFNGEQLEEAGIYTTTYHPRPGVDSTVTLNLTVFSPIIHETVAHISDQQTYLWKGHELNHSGTYDSVYTSVVSGCDSIERLRLTVHPTYSFLTTRVLCQGESFSWRRFNGLQTSGIYYDSLRTSIWNLDSVYTLDLTVNPSYRHDTTVHMCAGDYYEFGGEARYDGGYYTHQLNTQKGCDSLFTLTLIKHPTHLLEERKTICKGDAYDWHGLTLTMPGVYDDSLLTTSGCDSIHRLVLSVHNTFYQESHADICEGDYYNFNGRQLNETGIYWDSLITPMQRCDSVYKLTLNVHHGCRQVLYDTICGSEYVMFGGRAIYEGGTYIDSLLTTHGCDSIVTLHLMHYPTPFTRVVRDICRGESVVWTQHGGQPVTLSVGGIYTDTLVSAISRCDSIVELRLAVYNTYYTELNADICSNTFYNFNGRLLNQPGVYWDSLTTIHSGCDSVFRLTLTVHPAYLFDTTIYICDWENYYFAGQRITQSGTYYDRMSTRYGCDSVYTLHANVQASRRDSTAHLLCLGDTFVFNGDTLTNDGTYRDTISHPQTRQCIIEVVNLSFVAKSYIEYVQVDEACADDNSFAIHTNYTGARPATYSLLYDDASHAVGFSDIIDAPYQEHIYPPIPQRESGTYVRPDYYHAQLTVNNSVCAPDELSSIPVVLLLRYPSWIIEQNWNDVVALLNETYNGGYRFSAYEWMVNNSPTGNTRSYLYLPNSLGSGDEVSIRLTRAGETYAVPSCPITIYDKSAELVSAYPVLAHPTGVPGQIRINAKTDGFYQLFSTTGQLLSAGSFSNGDQLTLQTNGADACYILRFSTPAAGVHTQKLIIH